jgi:limonene-1,2-epoxide hydrolase
MTPSETVTAFCDAVSRSALDEAMVFIADDCAYHNMPMPLVEGAAGVRATLAGFIQLFGSLRIETLRQIAVGEWVMNERLDHFDPPGGTPYGLPVAGSFRVQDGRITVWNDYFDVRQFSAGTGINL